MPSKVGRPAAVRLAKLLAPVVASASSGASLGESAASLLGALSAEDFDYFYGLMEPRTEIWAGEGYVPICIHAGIAGAWATDYGAMVLVMVEHLKFNFSSLFTDLRSLVLL
jgi:hypothetical protein